MKRIMCKASTQRTEIIIMAGILLFLVPEIAYSQEQIIVDNQVGANLSDSLSMPVKSGEVTEPAASDINTSSLESGVSHSVLAEENASVAHAIEIPPGILYGKFSKEDGPFLIMGSIIVPSGEVLEFGPGCTIYMGGTYSTITVFGQIVVKGTAMEPVSFISAKAKPNPWDWDRIYCRSRSRSIFEHCNIRHSNYGVLVENGSAKMSNVLFEKNSIHALVVKNSDVTLERCTMRKGHVLALLCESGASVTAESLTIVDNISGVACDAKSSFVLNGGLIARNTSGLVMNSDASIAIVGADITRNKTGVVSQIEIPAKMRSMVFGNTMDIKIAGEVEMKKLLRPPEAVKSIVLPNSPSQVDVRSDFSPGFSALAQPRESQGGFIGNVTGGFSMYVPHSLDTIIQTRYLGEQGNDWYRGIQPDLQLFVNGRRGDANVNMLVDFSANQWTGLKKNMLNLSMEYAAQSLVLGDFYQSHSTTSISGRKMTGVKYSGEFMEMGRGNKRFIFDLAAGESEVPKDSGSNELEIYNQTVDTGMSVRQQITYVAGITMKPTLNSSISVTGIIGRDQGNTPIMRPVITDPAAPDPIASETGCIDGKIALLDGKVSLSTEIDLGTHDTVNTADDIDKIAWYNPGITQSIGDVFSQLGNWDAFVNHYSYNFSMGSLLGGYDAAVSFTETRPLYFSAGNPYVETDTRKIECSMQRQIIENLNANAKYEYQRTSASNVFDLSLAAPSPLDRNNISLSGEYLISAKLPSLSLGYTFSVEHSRQIQSNVVFLDSTVISTTDTTVYTHAENIDYDDRLMKNLVEIEAKQQIGSGFDYSLKYQLLRPNDMSDYVDTVKNDERDGIQQVITGRLGLKIGKVLRNKFSARLALKQENKDTLQSTSYKISDAITWNILPRILILTLKGEYSNKTDEEYNSDAEARTSTVTSFKSIEAELKYSFTAKLAIIFLGRYEKSEDQTVGSAENYTAKVGSLHLSYLF